MSFDSDFDELFGGVDPFTNGFVKKFRAQFDEIFKEIKDGKIKGTLETREINEPGVKGYIIKGSFGSDRALEPLEPLKPSKRKPLPERPFELSKEDFKGPREPLTDVFEEEEATKIYVELPGEEEQDIHLNFIEDSIEVKAESFYKIIELHDGNFDKQRMTSKYKNGVLEITIPKQTKLRKEDTEKEKLV